MAPRTASFEIPESVRAGGTAALDTDEAYARDTVRGDDGERAHGSLVDIEIEIDRDFRVDIDISRFD